MITIRESDKKLMDVLLQLKFKEWNGINRYNSKTLNKEHKKGPLMAPKPKANCKLAPAATNLSLVIKSLVCASIKENIGKLHTENAIKKI